MTKEEMSTRIAELEDLTTQMCEVLMMLEDKISKVKIKPEGRKDQVLKVLQAGPITVGAIAKRLGISSRNVSSQLTYLRKDGYEIATTSTGKKMLM